MPPITNLQVINTAIPALSGLLGVLIGGALQWWQADSIARRQRADAAQIAARADAAAAKQAGDNQARAAYPLILHLEKFAYNCAEAVAANDEPDGKVTWVPELSAWPPVNWESLGPDWQVRLMDFARVLSLRKSYIRGDAAEAFDDADKRYTYSMGAANLGLDAWMLAAELRRDAGIAKFDFPTDGWNYPEMMRDHLEEGLRDPA
ncbi:hypothetical protein [Brevundimonas vesicularis]|uniref:hypothetical protein n=1 Tax=Brevundimonas vesicularis TaxID=41276 RepID=UPI0022ABF3D5|nr:hypothetical protein [Brevundimonas vesicularis]